MRRAGCEAGVDETKNFPSGRSPSGRIPESVALPKFARAQLGRGLRGAGAAGRDRRGARRLRAHGGIPKDAATGWWPRCGLVANSDAARIRPLPSG